MRLMGDWRNIVNIGYIVHIAIRRYHEYHNDMGAKTVRGLEEIKNIRVKFLEVGGWVLAQLG